MLISSILSKMSVLDNELDIAVGGADETRAITALDMAQDALEAVLARIPDILGNLTTIATVASTETTAWPSSLLRLDNAFLLDANGRQRWEVDIIQEVGGQAPGAPWPFTASALATSPGAPVAAYTNRRYFYWRPLPDAAYTVRLYGLVSATDITSRSQTFEYPDILGLPCAAYAVRMMEMGVDDPSDELKALAEETFNPAIDALKRPVRQRPVSRVYSQVHRT